MAWSDLEKISAGCNYHSMRDRLQQLVYSRSELAFKRGDAARDAIESMDDVKARQERIRSAFLKSIGGLPSTDADLNAKVVGALQERDLKIEKVVFESRPGVPVTANLYVPNGIVGLTGAVLFLCGHGKDAKLYNEYQVACRHLAAAGLVVLAQDPIGQGERLSYYENALKGTTVNWGSAEHDYAGTQCLLLGDSIARYFLHDAMRGLDYLCSRPEVDPKRVGVTGQSGGGTQTCMMMMADPRVAAAAPATFVTSRQAYLHAGGIQDAEQIWPQMTANGFDHEDFLVAMCPKPVCVLAAKYDFFPIEGTRRTVERCRRFWRMVEHESSLELIEDCATHAYTPMLARAAARFFSKHLLGKAVDVDSTSIQAVEPSKLWCMASGQVKAERNNAKFVYEENQDRLDELDAAREKTCWNSKDAYRESALNWLRSRINADRVEVEINPRFAMNGREEDLVWIHGFWRSQKDGLNEGLLFRHFQFEEKKLPVTLAVWNGGTTFLRSHLSWLRRTCAVGRAVLVLNVSGIGGSEPNPIGASPADGRDGALRKFNDDLMWLGDSMCALRAHDVLRALDVLRQWPGIDANDIAAYAHGTHGVYVELAAAIEPALSKIELHDELESFSSWVRARHYDVYDSRTILLPEVLRHFDLPNIRKWRKDFGK